MSSVFEAFTRKYRKQSSHSTNLTDNSSKSDSPTQRSFTAADFESLNCIRLLVFIESDTRRLLYDSQSVLTNDPNFRWVDEVANSDGAVNIQSDRLNIPKSVTRIQAEHASGNSLPNRHGFGFMESKSGPKPYPHGRRKFGSKFCEPSKTRKPVIKSQTDTKLLCEMIFGTMSMVYHGCTLKIHPNVGSDSRKPQTMISYLSQFNMEVLQKQARTRGESFADLENELYVDSMKAGQSLDSLDGSQTGPEAVTSLPCSLANLFIHDDLWSRRNNNNANRGFATPDADSTYSPDNNSEVLKSKAGDSISSVSSVSKQLWQTSIPAFYTACHDLSDLSISISGCKRPRNKLGVALTFPSALPAVEELIQTHIAIIEGYLLHVKNQVEFALTEKEKFFEIVNNMYLEVKEKILRLFFDERNIASTWLNINAGCLQTSAVSVFMTSLSRFGTREMSFVSGLVTELLCRHLSWINTVYSDEEPELDLSIAARTVVNKRWAQLCDLFGIASSPAKCYKVVICGKLQNSVKRYADILSYFIRVASLNKRYIRVPSIDSIVSSSTASKNDTENYDVITQTVLNSTQWTFSDAPPLRHSNFDEPIDSNFVSIELVDTKKLHQSRGKKKSKDESSVKDQPGKDIQDSPRFGLLLGDKLGQSGNEPETGSSVSTVKHELVTSKSQTGSVVTPGSLDSKDRTSSSAKGSSNVSPFLRENKEPLMSVEISPHKSSQSGLLGVALDDDARKQSVALVEEWMQNSAGVTTTVVSSDLPQVAESKKLEDETTKIQEVLGSRSPISQKSSTMVEKVNGNQDSQHLESSQIKDSNNQLQDSGFSDKPGEFSVRELEAMNQESDDLETDSGMPSDDFSGTERNLKGYTIVPLVEGQTLCAPEVFPCKTPASCLGHSLVGIQSNKYSQDAMLQTCTDPGHALLEAMHDSNRNFIVDSKPCVLVIDIDKLKFYLCENGCQYSPPLNCSKSIADTLTHALTLRRMGLKDHFCVSMIERSLHALVCQSLALSHKLLQHPDPTKILESLGIDASDLPLLKAIAAAIKTMDQND